MHFVPRCTPDHPILLVDHIEDLAVYILREGGDLSGGR
jgi:hypothetical protein